MIIENANEKDRDWFKRIEDMVKEDSMSLNYIKFYKPANVVAGFESHSRRLALKLTSELEFYNQWKVV